MTRVVCSLHEWIPQSSTLIDLSEGMAGGDDKGERIGGGRSIHTLLRKAL